VKRKPEHSSRPKTKASAVKKPVVEEKNSLQIEVGAGSDKPSKTVIVAPVSEEAQEVERIIRSLERIESEASSSLNEVKKEKSEGDQIIVEPVSAQTTSKASS
jgi:hypothetical protein